MKCACYCLEYALSVRKAFAVWDFGKLSFGSKQRFSIFCPKNDFFSTKAQGRIKSGGIFFREKLSRNCKGKTRKCIVIKILGIVITKG